MADEAIENTVIVNGNNEEAEEWKYINPLMKKMRLGHYVKT